MELAEAEESALRRREAELMDDTKVPQSPAEWERLMTSEPDNSMVNCVEPGIALRCPQCI